MQVYQRQIMKSDLADATMQGGGGMNRLSHDELRQLFHLDMGPECSTRKLLEASKAGSGLVWLDPGSSNKQLPGPLAAAAAIGVVTAVSTERQHEQQQAEAEVQPGMPSAAAVGTAGAGPLDVEELEVDEDFQ